MKPFRLLLAFHWGRIEIVVNIRFSSGQAPGRPEFSPVALAI